MDKISFNASVNSDLQFTDISFSHQKDSLNITQKSSSNEVQTRPRVFSLTPIPGTSNVQSKKEAGHLIGPTLVNIDKSETNSLQSDQSTSAANDVRYTSESPVQVIKVEGSNRLCSRGAASPDVILVSIAAVAKRSQ